MKVTIASCSATPPGFGDDPLLVSELTALGIEAEIQASRVIDKLASRFGARPLYARVDMLRDEGGDPVLLELEAVEPNLYLVHAEGRPDASPQRSSPGSER